LLEPAKMQFCLWNRYKDAIRLSVLDLTLYDMDGKEVLKLTPADIPTLILTASERDRSEEMFELGAKNYLQKGTEKSLKKFVEILEAVKSDDIN
jgi:DNA-binding response OmpR family regulator